MLDALLRPLKERLLAPLARAMGRGVPPLAVTIAAFGCGLAAAMLAADRRYGAALALWIANRALDGLDGTLARAHGRQSDLGGYVDIVLDFVVYAAIPIGLVLGAPSMALSIAALAMLAGFYVNAASWMYLSALLERRGAGARERGELTSVTMPDGLIGGAETIAFYALFLLLPRHLVPLFWLMTALVVVTVAQRLMWASRRL